MKLSLKAMRRHLPYGITQCYLQMHMLSPAGQAGQAQFIYSTGMEAELTYSLFVIAISGTRFLRLCQPCNSRKINRNKK